MKSSLRDLPVREKIFDVRRMSGRQLHHTLTDDLTLFLLHRNKERVERGEKPMKTPWLVRLFKGE